MKDNDIVPSPEAALYLGSRSVNLNLSTATATRLFPGNGNRVRLILIRDGNSPSSGNGATLKAGPNATDLPFAIIIGSAPFIMLKVEDYGPLLTGEIWSTALNADGFATAIEIFRTR